jgi:large subunit ribosomal protein L32
MSRANTRARRSQWKATLPTLVACPRCTRAKRPHAACGFCGTYDGRTVIEVGPRA